MDPTTIWIIVAIVVVGLIIWYLLSGSKKGAGDISQGPGPSGPDTGPSSGPGPGGPSGGSAPKGSSPGPSE